MISPKPFRRPSRSRGEYLSLLGALSALGVAAILGVVVWAYSGEETPNAAEVQASAVSQVQETSVPTLAAPSFKDKVRRAVAPVVDLPAKVTNPLEFIPDWPDDEQVSFLLLGIDKREDDPFAKTDTIMVLKVDPGSGSAILVSIPRDVCLEKCETEPYRINTVLFLEGAERLRERVSDLVGFPIDYYLTMDFDGFVGIVDLFGGVDVVVERDIVDYKYPNAKDDGFDPFILRAGTHRLNGATALKYVRTRWEDPEGDFGRMERQQQFLTSIRDQILTPESIVKAPALVGRVIEMFESNVPVTKIPSLAKLSLQIPPSALKVANIDYTESRVYPAEGENGAKILIPNVGLIQRYVAQVVEEARQAGSVGRNLDYEPVARQQLEP